jgi:hypothetical protein
MKYGYGISPSAIPAGPREMLALVCGMLGMFCLASTCFGQFQGAQAYTAPGFPQRVVVADFNHDSNLDVATATAGGGTVVVLLGNGDGTLQAYKAYSNGNDPVAVSLGDFNGDGNPDLAVSNNDQFGTVSIFLGNGDGTFQPNRDTQTGGGVGLIWDFDGDGRQDLIVPIGNTLAIFRGNGDGTFQAPTSITVGVSLSFLVVADFNLDGRWDLAGVSSDGTISVLLGNGDGTFQTHVDFAGGNGQLVVADFNGDGKPDIAAAECCANTLAVHLGNGDGTFQPATLYFDPVANNGTVKIATGDFNNDGKLDLATPAVTVFVGKGDGTFNTPYADVFSSFGNNDVAVGDFNGDGNLDVVTASENSAVVVLLGNGDGTFQSSTDYGTPAGPIFVVESDFNNDGNPDLAVVDGGSNGVSIFLGKDNGALQKPANYVTGTNPTSVVSADFNRDGNIDLAVTNPFDNNVSILLGNGNGTFPTFQTYATGNGPTSVAAGDFNGDGKTDLAVANTNDSTVSILLGNGDGSFHAHSDIGVRANPASVAVGDFNRDGKADLAVTNPGSSTVSVLLGNGDGTFQARQDYPTGLDPRFTAIGDFDGDGTQDLAVAFVGNPDPFNFVRGGVSVFINRGDGSFLQHVDYSAGVPLAVAIEDFNGDGKQDLAAASGGIICRVSLFGVDCFNDSRVELLLGKGDGTFPSPIVYFAGVGVSSLAVPDLNRDGRPDLAVTNSLFGNTVTVFLNNATTFPEFGMSVSKTGSGSGTVTSNPAGIDCGIKCSSNFVRGVTVALTVTTVFGFRFDGWSGAGCSGAGTCSVAMTSDQVVIASFTSIPDFSISAAAAVPDPISPGQSSSASVDLGTVNGFNSSVSLTCSVQPMLQMGPQCSLTPSSVNPGTPATLTATTTSPTMALALPLGRSGLVYGLWLPVFGLALVGISHGPRREEKVKLLGFLLCFLLFAGLVLQAACGGSSSEHRGSPGTPRGQYTITINGTSGSLQHSTTTMLTVQ